MHPTPFGWKAIAFLGLLTVAFYASPYTNLFFLLLTFFAALLAASVSWTARNVRGIGGRLELLRAVPAGAAGARVGIELEARRRTRTGLAVTVAVAGRRDVLEVGDVAVLEPAGVARSEGALPALPRGVHRVTRVAVRSSAPLGFWRAEVPIAGPTEIVVHAAPIAGGSARTAHRVGAGDGEDTEVAAARGDAGVRGLRGWRSGDALRAVDWRATARRRTPIVREFDDDAGRATAVWLDRRCAPAELEDALSELVTLALRARDAAEQLTVRTQGLDATFGDGARSFDALLRWTATASVHDDDAPPPGSPDGACRLPRRARGDR